MDRGYIKTWRKVLDKGWIKNHKLWAFWSYCLLKASHKDHKVIIGRQIVHLKPGQFVFGLKKASLETGLSIQQIRALLTILKKAGNLTIKTTNKFSIITIVNWHIYQGDGGCEQQADEQTNNKQMTTYKNGKNGKKKDSCPQQDVVDLYHGFLPGLPKVRDWSPARQAALRTRWNEAVPNSNGLRSNTLEWWEGFFKFIGESDFLMGRVDRKNAKPFRANLEWIVQKKNFINILEGKYH